MDRDISSIAHRRHDYCSPIGRESVQELLNVLDLPAGTRCADYGCGKGQLLLDIVNAYDTARGDGYDANEAFIREAIARAADGNLQERARFHIRTVESIERDEAVDLAICFGSTHIFGGFADAVRALANIVRPGGKVLLADGYWKRKPSEKFLHEFFESSEDDLLYVPQMLDVLNDAGLKAPYVTTSSDGEWERYEGLWAHELERAAEQVDDSAAAESMRTRARKSRDNYWIHGGRETLGYVAVIASKPGN